MYTYNNKNYAKGSPSHILEYQKIVPVLISKFSTYQMKLHCFELKRLHRFPEYYLKLITTTCNTLFCGMLQQCGMENIFSSLPQPNKKKTLSWSLS